MSNQKPNEPLQISLTDCFALIANQGRMVSEFSEAIMRGQGDLGPAHIIGATNRLSDLVTHMVRMLSSQDGKTDKAA